MSINRVTLVGRLTRDVEIKKTASGKSVAEFTLALNRIGSDTSDFIDCTAWEQRAEYIGTYGKKGEIWGVDGRLETQRYEGRDGNKHQRTKVVAERVESYMPRESSQSTTKRSMNSGLIPQTERTYAPEENEWGIGEINPADLPF